MVGNSDISNPDDPVIARYLTTGDLDLGFGFFGVSEIDSSIETPVNAVAIRPTGQIVTAGQFGSGTMFVAQDVAAGGADPAFNPGPNSGSNGSLWNSAGAGANDLALTAGGSAVAAGFAVDFSTGDDNFAVLRVSQDGTTLTHFGGSDGVDVAALAGNAEDDDSANAVAIDPASNDVIVAGSVDPTPTDGATDDNEDVAVARFTSSGVLDTGFGGGDGVVTFDLGQNTSAEDVAIQASGKIVVVGDRDADPGAGLDLDHFVARFTSNGALDNGVLGSHGFGDGEDGSTVQSAVATNNSGTALTLLPDGRIVAGGNTLAGLSDWVIARYSSAGLPDTSFDGDGSRTYSFPGEAASLSSLALQQDGKVVIGGSILSTERDFAVGRALADNPPPPTLTSTTPASPANNNNPSILGSAEPLSTVTLYANPTCTPPVLTTGSAADFLSPGFPVSVPDNSTTTYSATAANTSGSSACSTANVTYSEVTPPPAPPAGAAPGPPATTPTATPTVAKKCKKAKKGAVAAKKCKKK